MSFSSADQVFLLPVHIGRRFVTVVPRQWREGKTGGYNMLFADKIKMKYGCWNSQYPEEIDQIYIRGYGWYAKSVLYDHLTEHPKSIAVNIWPYPCLIPALSSNREKYVRSNPDAWKHDDLMDLPRE